jgi:predicted O-methyltransferase YrrM
MIPPLVSQALHHAASQGFDRSCTPEVGRLLRLLAGHQRTGSVGEIGTGCGVGTAWMASALQPGVSLRTVESDSSLSSKVADLFQLVPAVRVLSGDWREILPHGPFALLFVDAADPKRDHPDELLEVMQPGGMIVLDDFTPIEAWPPTWHDRVDSMRDFWLHDPRLRSVELRVAPTMSVILAITPGRP